MNCQEAQELLIPYTLGLLDSQETEEMRLHLSTDCSECAEEMRSVQETLSYLPLELTPVAPPSQIKERLLRKIERESKTLAPGELEIERFDSPSRSWQSWVPYIAASIVAVVAGANAARWNGTSPPLVAAHSDRYEHKLAEAREAFAGPAVRLAALDTPEHDQRVQGTLLVDAIAGQIHFVAYDLGQPADNTQFVLWLLSADEKWTSIGVLEASRSDISAAVLDLPQIPSDTLRAVVTEEPRGKIEPQPRGKTRLEAKF